MPSDSRPSPTEPSVTLRDDVDDAEWERLCASDPRATLFHTSRLHRDAGRTHDGWQSRWLEARRVDRLVAGLPVLCRRHLGFEDWVSGIGGSYGGPVAEPDAADAEARLGRAFRDLGGWRRRRLELVWAGREPPRGVWEGLRPLSTAVLDVDPTLDFERLLLQQLPKNRRNECRRSDRRGLRAEIDERGEHLSRFYSLYRERCEEWGSPPVPQDFLRSVLDAGDAAHLFVARTEDGRVVGGHLTVELPGELFAWVGTTERIAGVFPSSLLIREELRWCHRRKITRLNLGSSLGIEGVRNYKRLLGAREDRRWILRREPRWSRWLKG